MEPAAQPTLRMGSVWCVVRCSEWPVNSPSHVVEGTAGWGCLLQGAQTRSRHGGHGTAILRVWQTAAAVGVRVVKSVAASHAPGKRMARQAAVAMLHGADHAAAHLASRVAWARPAPALGARCHPR